MKTDMDELEARVCSSVLQSVESQLSQFLVDTRVLVETRVAEAQRVEQSWEPRFDSLTKRLVEVLHGANTLRSFAEFCRRAVEELTARHADIEETRLAQLARGVDGAMANGECREDRAAETESGPELARLEDLLARAEGGADGVKGDVDWAVEMGAVIRTIGDLRARLVELVLQGPHTGTSGCGMAPLEDRAARVDMESLKELACSLAAVEAAAIKGELRRQALQSQWPAPGAAVYLANVEGAPEANGLRGTCEELDLQTGRSRVMLETGERRLVRPENMVNAPQVGR